MTTAYSELPDDDELLDDNALADEQIDKAEMALTMEPQDRLRFRPDSLHRVARYLSAGQLWIVAAQTGIGKTTLLNSVIDDFVRDGRAVAMLGLEQEDFELRIAFACLRAGVPRSIATENSWREYPDGPDMYARVRHHLREQREHPLRDQLLLLPQRYIDTPTLEKAAKSAGDFGAAVLVVDHLHHIKASSGSYQDFANLVQTSKRIAEENGIVNISAAQINRAALQGGHKLTRYMPAQLNHIQGGGVIEQNANVVLNLYRPIIVPQNEKDKQAIKAAMKGELEPQHVLQPYKMGVAILKHRMRGELEGKRCVLALEDGKLVDQPSWATNGEV